MDVSYAYWNIFFFSAALAIYTTSAVFVLFKVKLHIDKSAIIMMALYFISLTLKLVSWSLYFQENENKQSLALRWMEIVDLNALFLITLSFYYFVFEMRGVVILIKAATPEINVKMQYNNNRLKYIFISLSVLLSIGTNVIYFRSMIKREYETETSSAVSVIMWILAVSRTLMDLYITFVFCKLFFTFVRLRAIRLAQRGREFSCLQKLTISWISLLILLSTLNIILNNIVNSLYIYEAKSDNPVSDFYQDHRFVWFATVDFLKGITMVYLFYKQGQFFLEYTQFLKHKKQLSNQSKLNNSQQPKVQITKDEIPQNILADLKFSVLSSDPLRIDNVNYSHEIVTEQFDDSQNLIQYYQREGQNDRYPVDDQSSIKGGEEEQQTSDFLDSSSFMDYFQQENQFRNYLISQFGGGDFRRSTALTRSNQKRKISTKKDWAIEKKNLRHSMINKKSVEIH
eukprot:403371075